MSKKIEMINKKFGRLTVIKEVDYIILPCGQRVGAFLVSCECGTENIVRGYCLRSGHTQSCGCTRLEGIIDANTKHGEAGIKSSSEYIAWKAMIQRCEYKKHVYYVNYGGRGIKVCKRWRDDFNTFLSDMGRKPSSKHSLDRIDGNKDYEPNNCRWATSQEQNSNRRKFKPRKKSSSSQAVAVGT